MISLMPMIQTQNNDTDDGAAMNGGRRPTVVAAPVSTSPELSARPRRRTFTAKDKLRILADIDRATGYRGDRGHSAPRRTLLLDLVGLAPSARRRCFGRIVSRQARSEYRHAQPTDHRGHPFTAYQRPPHPASGSRRGDHRHSKKSGSLAGHA